VAPVTIVVRPGSTDDAAAALDVFVAAETARRGRPVDDDEERVADRLRGGTGWLMVARDDERLVGMAVGYDTRAEDGAGELIPGSCHLSMVFVTPDVWGRGVGGQIVDAVLTEARRRGYDHMQLWTHEDNLRGQRLYASRGFTRSGREKDDVRGQPIALWERAL
jgi:GNAT superfamily N-acetyltransferase